MSPDLLLSPSTTPISCNGNCYTVVWAFPIYSWGIPPVVEEVMRKSPFDSAVSNAVHHMLTTCGDDIGYADRQWRRIMKERGVKTGGAYAVVMPNTYTLMKGFDVDSTELAAAKLAAMPGAIRAVADSIKTGGADIVVRKRFSWIKSQIIYPSFKRYAMSSKPFATTAACTGCGLCARSCPMNNIIMRNGLPRWENHCALCLRCYHRCPQHAVCYGKATAGKGQYQSSFNTARNAF
ncbi:MAG: EFR1 family ferrodoxin [Muribaculaceae bacterium]|nr:EFR1 family ferrodoxin [Muribaculaceae bacterium]